MPTSPSVFRAGVVAVTAGSPIVTGTGTGFLLNGVTGGMFSLAGHAVPVLSVDSETQLTLAYNWPGATASGVADYAISLESALAADATFVHSRLVSVLDAIGAIENARPNYEVLSVGSNAPPGSPVVGGLYVIGTAPTGAWTAHANELGKWTGSSWLFTSPDRGTTVVSAATGIVSIWNGAGWLPYVAPSAYFGTLMPSADVGALLTALGFSSFIQSLRDDVDQAAARTTLGAQAALGFTPVNKAGDTGVGGMTFAGPLNLPTGLAVGAYHLRCANPAFLASLANVSYLFAGLFIVHNASNGAIAIFLASGTTVTLVSSNFPAQFSTANGNSNTVNFFYLSSIGGFVLQNGYTSDRAISVMVLSTRSSI